MENLRFDKEGYLHGLVFYVRYFIKWNRKHLIIIIIIIVIVNNNNNNNNYYSLIYIAQKSIKICKCAIASIACNSQFVVSNAYTYLFVLYLRVIILLYICVHNPPPRIASMWASYSFFVIISVLLNKFEKKFGNLQYGTHKLKNMKLQTIIAGNTISRSQR